MDMSFEEWLKPSGTTKEFVTNADNGRNCEITNVRLGNTKYGTKMFVDVRFEDGTEKTLVIGKSLAIKLVELLGEEINSWIGRKGKIQSIMINVPRIGLKERPMFQPL